MSRVHLKLLIAGIVLVGAVGYLCYAGVSAGRYYYLSVDAFLSSTEHHDQSVRLYGLVGADPDINIENLTTEFLLLGDNQKLKIKYDGAIPDMFKAGGEVVVLGRMGQDNVFNATEILTKCASKYQTKKAESETPS